jgi:hypothetical protein
LSEHQLARIELRTVRWQIEEEDVERIEKRAQHDRHHRRRVHFRIVGDENVARHQEAGLHCANDEIEEVGSCVHAVVAQVEKH